MKKIFLLVMLVGFSYGCSDGGGVTNAQAETDAETVSVMSDITITYPYVFGTEGTATVDCPTSTFILGLACTCDADGWLKAQIFTTSTKGQCLCGYTYADDDGVLATAVCVDITYTNAVAAAKIKQPRNFEEGYKAALEQLGYKISNTK